MRKPSQHIRQKGSLASLAQKRIFRVHESVFLTHQQVKIGATHRAARRSGGYRPDSASTCPKRRDLALQKIDLC